MVVVFAYHDGDAKLALESAKAITAMGPNLSHKAIVATPNAPNSLIEIMAELKKSFPAVEHITTTGGFNGWPLGPNQMFLDVAVRLYGQTAPWIFWEPDCVPMKVGWLDDLEDDYRKNPAIMGHLYEGGMDSNGKNIYKMIVGSAVYPPQFLDHCPAARSLGDYNIAYRSAGTIPEPWDVRCRFNFLKIGRDTPLMRTYWKSVNYQWKDGKIVFFASDPEAQSIQNVTCPDRTISSKAVVIHGCKDGSLHAMAQRDFFSDKVDYSVDCGQKDGLSDANECLNDIKASESDETVETPAVIQRLFEAVGRPIPETVTVKRRGFEPRVPKKRNKRVYTEQDREVSRQRMKDYWAKRRERNAADNV
jgi:hypothetical protein